MCICVCVCEREGVAERQTDLQRQIQREKETEAEIDWDGKVGVVGGGGTHGFDIYCAATKDMMRSAVLSGMICW